MREASFNSLDLDSRMAIVNEFGTYISDILYYRQAVVLYLVEDKYIEVFYDPSENRIVQIEILDPHHDRVNLYMKNVDLSDLLK